MITLCIFAGIIGIILLIVSKMISNERKANKNQIALVGWAGIVLAILFFIASLFYIVNPGKVGVEILFGKVTKYAPSGLNFKNPFANIVIMDLQTIKYETKLEGASKDLQEIGVDIAINYRLDYKRIEELYNNVGKDYEIKVIQPAVMNIAKAAISQFPINDVIVKRNDLMQAIFDTLKTRLDQYYIILETVNLNNITFAEAFTKAVEEKQVEEQKVQTAEYQRQQAEKNKATTILVAEGEAQKQLLLRNTTSAEVIQLKWIEKWNGQLPTYLSSDKSTPMINLNNK